MDTSLDVFLFLLLLLLLLIALVVMLVVDFAIEGLRTKLRELRICHLDVLAAALSVLPEQRWGGRLPALLLLGGLRRQLEPPCDEVGLQTREDEFPARHDGGGEAVGDGVQKTLWKLSGKNKQTQVSRKISPLVIMTISKSAYYHHHFHHKHHSNQFIIIYGGGATAE